MYEFFDFLNHNGLWVMIIAVVFIGSWFKHRQNELKVHEDLRIKQMEHEQKLKELEIEKAKLEMEKAKTAKLS